MNKAGYKEIGEQPSPVRITYFLGLPMVFCGAHNPKVAGSNPAPATK